MKKNSYRDQRWFPMAVAICIGVLFYFILTHLGSIWHAIGSIAYYFYPLIAGGIIAYLINPLMRLFENKVFRSIGQPKLRRILALILSELLVLVLIVLIIGMLVPQLYDSIVRLFANKDTYIAALSVWLDKIGAGSVMQNFEGLFSTSQDFLDTLSKFISENGSDITSGISKLGGNIASWAIGFIFSIYFLADKETVSAFGKRLLGHLIRDKVKYDRTMVHLQKIDFIMTRYLICSIIDGIIIGIITGIFMAAMGMQYVGLIAVIVGVTNLVPTFGPLIGEVVGTLILLMVNPAHALYFLIFVLLLQTVDGYILKPKLYGETLGVSGLLILIAIIIGGRIFGVWGILLAIPFAAICDYLSKNVFSQFIKDKTGEDELPEQSEVESMAESIEVLEE